MFKEERYAYILNQLKINCRVVVTDLADVLHVSYDTVRRDLTELSKSGKLVKVHGGALPVDFNEVLSYCFKSVQTGTSRSE